MRHTVLLFLLISVASTKAQTSVNYSEVVKADSIPAKVLFERARAWFVSSFHDSKNVLEINDKESGELSGKGDMHATSSIMGTKNYPYGWLFFQISIHTKDGRYKLEISEYRHESVTSKGFEQSVGRISDNVTPDREIEVLFCGDNCQKKLWNDLQQQCRDNNKELSESLKKVMLTPIKSDW